MTGIGTVDDQPIAANATAAAADVRSMIDHQVAVARDFDTKLSAMIAALGAAAGVVASRVVIDTPERLVASAISSLAVAITVGLAFSGLRPRAASFGAEPTTLQGLVTDSRDTFAQELLGGLVNAYATNQTELAAKAGRYQLALLAFFVALLSVALLLLTGALR